MPGPQAPHAFPCRECDSEALTKLLGRAVYSYGVVLWELLTGEVPWVKLHPMQARTQTCFTLQATHVPLVWPSGHFCIIVILYGLYAMRMIDSASSISVLR